jgi:hypothetical protein
MVLVELSAGHSLAFDCGKVAPRGANAAEVFILRTNTTADDLGFDFIDA